MKKKIIITLAVVLSLVFVAVEFNLAPVLFHPGGFFMARKIPKESIKQSSPSNLKNPLSIKQILKNKKEKMEKTFKETGAKVVRIDFVGNNSKLPFTIKSNARIFNSGKVVMVSEPWMGKGEKIIFKKYKKEEHIPFGDFDFYSYDIVTRETKKIPEYKNWRISPGGAMGVKFIRDIDGSLSSEKSGFMSIKNMKTGEEKTVGGAILVKKATFNNQYYSDLFLSPATSPDGKYVAFYDGSIPWKDGNKRAVSLISSNAKNSDDKMFLGWTNFAETDRSSMGTYFYWSPDSSKFFALDDNVIFSVKPEIKEVYRPKLKGFHWQWSPDSRKILSFGGGPYFYTFNFDGSGRKAFLMEGDINNGIWKKINAVAWASDSKHVVYMYNNALYFLDTATGKQSKIISTSPKETYRNFISMSPNEKYILYQMDDEIWIIETNLGTE